MQPGGTGLLAKHPRRENGPTCGEKLDSGDEAEEGAAIEPVLRGGMANRILRI